MDEQPRQPDEKPRPTPVETPEAGFLLAVVLGRLTAGLVLAGGVGCGLLVLDHFACTPEGLHPLALAGVIGAMVLGAALATGLWLLAEILAGQTGRQRTSESQPAVQEKLAEKTEPSVERLQAAIDDLRELVLLDEEGKAAHRTADQELARERAEQRNRLYAELQSAAGAKRWPDAVRLSEQLLAEYPYSLEAKTVADKLPTLRANAQIARRQELEQDIKTLVHEQKYPEAVALAKQLIGQYPDSPQAKALLVQLPRLEQLAAIALAIANGTLVPVAPIGMVAPAGSAGGESSPAPTVKEGPAR